MFSLTTTVVHLVATLDITLPIPHTYCLQNRGLQDQAAKAGILANLLAQQNTEQMPYAFPAPSKASSLRQYQRQPLLRFAPLGLGFTIFHQARQLHLQVMHSQKGNHVSISMKSYQDSRLRFLLCHPCYGRAPAHLEPVAPESVHQHLQQQHSRQDSKS